MKRISASLLVLLLIPAAAIPAEASKDAIQKVERYLNKAVENDYSGSVLIALNGKVLLSKGYGFADSENKKPFTADTIFDIGSITKQFTAACILKLEMQGKLKTQDTITKYFDSVPEDKKNITLHHLLTHTAGLTDGLGGDEEWIGREEYLKAAMNSKLLRPPGTYSYSNVGYSLLAMVVERITGNDYEQFLSDQLLKPAGMKQTGYILPAWDKSKMAIGYAHGKRWGTTFDKSNYPKGVTWHLKGNGGIHSTIGDLYLWTRALRGNEMLSENAKQKYFAPHVKTGEDESYAYGWSVMQNQRKETMIAHNGGNGFFMDTLAMIPQKDFVVIVSTNRSPKNTDVIATRIDRMVFEELEELTDNFTKKYTGTYALPSGVTFPVFFNENDEAVAVLNDAESWRVLGGTDKEDPARIKHFDERTREMLRAFHSGDTAKLASASGMEQQAVEENFPGFRKEIEEENGKWKDFEVLGTVDRRNGEYHLTLVRLKCEKKDVLNLIIWHQNNLSGFRDLPQGNMKNFEHTKGSEFFSESNNQTMVFGDLDKKPVIRIKTSAKEIIAHKR